MFNGEIITLDHLKLFLSLERIPSPNKCNLSYVFWASTVGTFWVHDSLFR